MYGQFSPGDLTEQHKSLEGINNCKECHVLKKKVSNRKCVNCHDQIKSLVDSNKGYHGYEPIKSKECKSCHSEHFGREFEIIHFDPETFDHNESGYTLVDAHKTVKCQSCHNKKNISNKELRDKKSTYLGLSTKCNSCHEDAHKPTLGDDCTVCHTVSDFKSTESFDHSQTEYQLTGQHKNLSCNKCHDFNSTENKISFAIQNYNSCNTCHKDTHKKKVSDNCSTCHVTSSFKSVVNQSSFDHSKTSFPLIGKHGNLECNKCHNDQSQKISSHSKCIACHNDYHKGEFVNNSVQTDCNECHSESGYTPSVYTIEKHNNIKFKLQGSHLTIPCENCHKKAGRWTFKNIGKNCYDCHQNIHSGYLSNKYVNNSSCSECHVVESWGTVTFDHNSTDFPLYGKHEIASCKSCHFKGAGDGSVIQQFSFKNNNCFQCHDKIHDKYVGNNAQTACTTCHSFDNWEVENFNHENTKFSLTGVHIKIQCTKCHIKSNVDNHISLNFAIKDFKCSDCH